jgi:anaerobic dimethyl sulfoxide reductase subunit B (iron-sulfur subunit)
MKLYGWLLDIKRCIECRACEVACKQWNGVEIGVGVRRREVRVKEYGVFPAVRQQAVSGACNHCDNAWCMKACPVKAISRGPNGEVLIDQDACVGCQQCAAFCPYGAPHFNVRLKKMDKCTMCPDRIKAGLEPACVTLCPTDALQWGPWEEIQKKGVAQIEGFANPRQTWPRIRFITEGYKAQ